MVMEHLLCVGIPPSGGTQEDLARLGEGRAFVRPPRRELSWG